MKQLLIAFLIGSLAMGLIPSCSSSRHMSRQDWFENYDDYGRPLPDRKKKKKHSADKASKDKSKPQLASGTAKDVIDVAYGWLGVPYRYGGDSRHGTDCSGLTSYAFLNGAGIKLPRSSSDQADFSRKISQNNLRPGDLVFFVNKPGGSRINHVGIYLGDRKMIHASSSQGVTVTSLDDPYWLSRLHKCGRVL